MQTRPAPRRAVRPAQALLAVVLATACGESDPVTAPAVSEDATWPIFLSHGAFDQSDGIYRIPYVDGSDVTVTNDHHDHSPPNRIDMSGDAADLEIVAAASGTIRAVVDRHGDAPGSGDGLSADGSQAHDDDLEHSCTDNDSVVGDCSDYNNYVWIEHPNGEWTKYSHFGTGTVTDNGWAVGDWIEAGDVLGVEGDIGAATGPHLHYEVGVPNDPDDLTPFTDLGGFMVSAFGVNLVPRTCDIPDLLYESGEEYTANPCAHQPPTADAGGPYEVDEGSTIVLDGSGSSDPEGLPLTYVWDPEDGLDDPSLAQPTFLGVDDGVVDFSLTVYDQVEALSDVAEMSVTVLNVGPTVTIDADQVTTIVEGETLQVLADFTDPGVLDAPFTAQVQCYDVTGFALAVDGTVSVTSDDGPLAGTVTADCPIGDTSRSGAPPAGTFTVTVTVTDKDGASDDASFEVTVTNEAPAPVIDLSGATSINGVPTLLAVVGENVDLDAQVADPGSDDLSLTWDWADGSTDQAEYLLDAPNPDPFPSPTVDPRDIMDGQSHAWAEACFYEIVLTAADDDGGEGNASAAVVIAGDAGATRGAGYWMTQYRGNRQDLSQETLACYLLIAQHMSAVFDEERDGTDSFDSATDALWTNDSRGRMYHMLDRQLLTAWLNFANGAFGWDDMVDTDGDGTPDTEFSSAVVEAENVRLDPGATRDELEEQKDILESINLMDES